MFLRKQKLIDLYAEGISYACRTDLINIKGYRSQGHETYSTAHVLDVQQNTVTTSKK